MNPDFFDLGQDLQSQDLMNMIFQMSEPFNTLEGNQQSDAQDANISSTNTVVSSGVTTTPAFQEPWPMEDPTLTLRIQSTGMHPPLKESGGDFDFDLCRETLSKSKPYNSWTYSESLHQVFIKANSNLYVRFKLGKQLDNKQYFVRALLVFQCNDYLSEAVKRCAIHSMEDDPNQQAHKSPPICKCVEYNLAGHVLRSSFQGSVYDFDPMSGRHSVLVPVPTPEELHRGDILSGHYYFACNTSCPSGMQRRQVQIIFTFEDKEGKVYGRRLLPVKICHCPKRDKDRLEKNQKLSDTKRPFQAVTVPVKKIKTEPPTDETPEDRDARLAELVQQQEEELNLVATLVNSMVQRHRETVAVLKQLKKLSPPKT